LAESADGHLTVTPSLPRRSTIASSPASRSSRRSSASRWSPWST